MGKSKEGRYNFINTGNFQLSQEILERSKITINEEYDGKEAIDIHKKYKILQDTKQKRKIEILDN